MASHPPETHPAIDLTQPLTLVPALRENHTDSAMQESSKDSTNEHKTLYVAFEAPSDAAFETNADGLALVVPSGPKTGGSDRKITPDSVDPAELVQIQALELAANRAEIARQKREQEELQRAIRLRDGWLDGLRNELQATKGERKTLAVQLRDTRANLESMTNKVAQQQAKIASLEAQIAERMSLTAFASDGPRTLPVARSAELLDLEKPARLEALDDDSPPFILNRKVMTIGRTRENDVYVPSALVSRDHARMLVSEESVVLFDVGSINGCFVNDELTRRHTLRDGDIVRFGDRSFRFSI